MKTQLDYVYEHETQLADRIWLTQPMGGGVVRFTRYFASVPPQWSDYQSFALRVPGLGGNILIVGKNIESASASAGEHTLEVTAHGYSVGDGLRIHTTYPIAGTASYGIVQVFRRVTSVVDVNNFKVIEVVLPGAVTFEMVENVGTRREERTVPVNSRVQHDYYLPGVTTDIDDPSDIPILQPTLIVDGEGNEVNTYSDDTTPSQTTYLGSTVGTEVVVEESNLEVYQGNIYVRRTRYAEAR